MVSKGDQFKCEICGIVCTVDNLCGCAECDLVCCSQPMKNIAKKKTRKRSAKKPTRKIKKKK